VLRQKPKTEPSAPAVAEAICVEEFRPAHVAQLVRRWQVLPADHPTVQRFPEFFRGLVRLDEGVK
jgi:hypothetical protein